MLSYPHLLREIQNIGLEHSLLSTNLADYLLTHFQNYIFGNYIKEPSDLNTEEIRRQLDLLTNLEACVEDKLESENKSYFFKIDELRRLLTAMLHMSIPGSDAEGEVLHCLCTPFNNESFQDIADLALGRHIWLHPNISKRFEECSYEKAALYQFIIYSQRTQVSNPEGALLIYDALLQLKTPPAELSSAQPPSLNDIDEIKQDVALVNYENALSLAQNALTACKNTSNGNPHEIKLLENLLEEKDYFPPVIQYLFKSPSFLSIFKEKYPGKTHFALSEYYLLLPNYLFPKNYQSTEILLEIPQEASPVIESHLHDYTEAMDEYAFNSQPIVNALNTKRQLLHNILNFVPAAGETPLSSVSRIGIFAKPASTNQASLLKLNKKEKQLDELLKIHFPTRLFSPKMRTNNGCFFDVISQCLNSLTGIDDTYCAKGLRLVSHEYVQKLEEKNRAENWVYQRFLIDAQSGYMDQSAATQQAHYNYLHYMSTIQYTAEEIEADTNLHGKTIMAGDRNIDGRIICETYGLKIHLINFFEDGSVKDEFFSEHFLIDTQGCHTIMEEDVDYDDMNLIHMAVYRDYFVPVVHQKSLRHHVSPQNVSLNSEVCDRSAKGCSIL